MTAADCAREREVLSAVLAGDWPHGCEGELTAHAAQCAVCRDVAAVAGALREDYETGRPEARLPAAGQVWWRAAVRARLDAGQAAARPITWIHGLTGASAAGLTVAAVGLAWPSVRHATEWAGSRLPSFKADLPDFADLAATAAPFGEVVLRGLPFAIAIGACLVLAPVALYFALSDD